MKLIKARVQNYRSVEDSEEFEIGDLTCLVGKNEAGKTAILQALQHINPPDSTAKLDALRDYPRSLYNDISTGRVKPSAVTVVEAHFRLDPEDIALLPPHDARVHFDGQTRFDARAGDIVRMARSRHNITLLHPPGYSYFAMLREKLHWSSTPRH